MDWTALVTRLHTILEPMPEVRAAWIAGSAAFGRRDEWSDVDLAVVSDTPDAVFDAVRAALPSIDRAWRAPEPTWHGHAQAFYRFADAPPLLLLDLVILRTDATNRFLDPVRHGTPQVLFDRDGFVRPGPSDGKPLDVDELALRFDLFAPFVDKAIARGDALEALQSYNAFVLRPLVQMLRLQHDPARHDYGVRYLRHDLPAHVVDRLERLAYPTRDGLAAASDEARAWLAELLGQRGSA